MNNMQAVQQRFLFTSDTVRRQDRIAFWADVVCRQLIRAGALPTLVATPA